MSVRILLFKVIKINVDLFNLNMCNTCMLLTLNCEEKHGDTYLFSDEEY